MAVGPALLQNSGITFVVRVLTVGFAAALASAPVLFATTYAPTPRRVETQTRFTENDRRLTADGIRGGVAAIASQQLRPLEVCSNAAFNFRSRLTPSRLLFDTANGCNPTKRAHPDYASLDRNLDRELNKFRSDEEIIASYTNKEIGMTIVFWRKATRYIKFAYPRVVDEADRAITAVNAASPVPVLPTLFLVFAGLAGTSVVAKRRRDRLRRKGKREKRKRYRREVSPS